MKAINLLSLIGAKKDLTYQNFLKYIEQFGMNPRIRESELDDLSALVSQMKKYSDHYDIFNNYYVGFMINRIGKEFDLLRIGEDTVVNIELKRESTYEKVIKQLIQNQYYLKFLDKEIYNFTYISSTNKLYALAETNKLVEVDFLELITKLNEQNLMALNDLNDLFDPTNYLVSLFNSPESFIEDKYFLSAQQNTYKREILNLEPSENAVFVSIEGGPGTGKSLLTYDIAKEYMKNSKKVLIFNCGKLNSGHLELKKHHQWPIEPISNFNNWKTKKINRFKKYDLLIFDEAQRLYRNKFFDLIDLVRDLKIKCIFSYDPTQCLTTFEMNNNIPKLIEEKLNPKKFELTTIMRHNKEIHDFINNLFDLSKRQQVPKYSNISIQYFSSQKATTSYLEFLKTEGWKVIDYTPKKYIKNPDNDHFIKMRDHDTDVVGQEFDYVAAVIDDYFYYESNSKLATKELPQKPYYQPINMLFQNINRTRKKLHIVVVNNADVLDRVLEMLG